LFASGIILVITIRPDCKPIAKTAPKILSLYVTLGFSRLAARNPSASRTVIAYAAWSSLAHAAVMTVMSVRLPTDRAELLITSAALGIIGALLIVLAPGKQAAEGEHPPA
jgi:hypothetical protein